MYFQTWGMSKAFRYKDNRVLQCVAVHVSQINDIDVSLQVALNQDLLGYVPQNVGPGLPQAAFLQPNIHPGQPRAAAENLRQLADRYLDHPGGRLRMISTDEGPAGGFIVAIILEIPNIL